jgi:hypothetical protein
LTAVSVIEQLFKDLLFNTTHEAFPVQPMKAWRGVEVWPYSFLTSVLDVGEWYRTDRFRPGK